jgi:hypothetical protein
MNEVILSIKFKFDTVKDQECRYDIPSHIARDCFQGVDNLSTKNKDMYFLATPHDVKKQILDNRKYFAEKIAADMVEFILNQMAASDTVDGYST